MLKEGIITQMPKALTSKSVVFIMRRTEKTHFVVNKILPQYFVKLLFLWYRYCFIYIFVLHRIKNEQKIVPERML